MQQLTNMQQLETDINENSEMEINKKDKDNVIIMNMEEYRNNIFDNETVEALLRSEDDIENGRTRKAIEVIKELNSKYGF